MSLAAGPATGRRWPAFLAWAVACEMYRQYGDHPHRYQPKPRKQKSRELHPDEMTAAQLARFDRERYGL